MNTPSSSAPSTPGSEDHPSTAGHPAPGTPEWPDEDEISLLDLLQTVAENLKLLILGPLAVGLAALGISFVVPPTFTAKTTFLPPQAQQSAAASLLQGLGALGGLAGAAAGIKNPNDQTVALLKSRAVQDALIDEFKLMERYESKFREDARKTLSTNARITSGKDGLISIEVDDKDPKVAADLANAHLTHLVRLSSRLALTEAQQRRQFFEKQVEETKVKLTTAETALRAGGVEPGALKANPATAVAALAAAQAQIAAQEVRIGAMRGYMTEGAPELRQALTELQALRAQVGKLEQSQAPNLGAAGVSAAPGAAGAQGDYVTRYRDYKYYETLFELFAKQYELARVDESREGNKIQVVDAATPPERKSKPKKALIAVIATLATGFALLLFVFVRQALRNAAQDEETAGKLRAIRRAIGVRT
jgi:uncharacterized protein involved in exopolysaccharide biosynthesis